MGKRLSFFHLGTLKTAFLMRKLPLHTRNLGISPNKQNHFKKEQRRPPSSPWPVSQEKQIL